MQAEEQALRTLELIAGERAQDGVAAEAREARAALAGRRFNVAVMGQFKRGKSTLINALLGRELLPADVAPITTAVTVVEYGARELASVRFVDGHDEEIAATQLRLFVSEEDNPGNRKGVRVARIELPCPLLASGMRLVDTPGVGSVFANNAEATREFVPRIDVAVVVLGSDPPITGDELALVKSVAPGVGRIFFVLNKADIVAEPVRVKAEAFTRRVLRDALGDDPGRLIHASALSALRGGDAGVTELTRSLSELAAGAGTELARASAARAARHLAAHVLGALDIERAALLSPTDEIDRRIATFLDAMRDIDDLALAALARTKAALSYDWSAWEEEKETFLVASRRALRANVENELARLDGASRRKIRNLAREYARAAGERQIAIWHERAAAEMRRRRESWTAQASERANTLIDRVAHAAAAAFDIPVARFEPEVLDLDAPPPVFEFFEDVIFLDPRAAVIAVRDALSSRRAVARRAAARAAAAADGWLQRNLSEADQTLVGWLDKLATGLDAALRARLDAARQEVLDAVAAGRRRRERGEMAVKERVEELNRQRTVVLDALAPLSVA
jgi:hypothetical protein